MSYLFALSASLLIGADPSPPENVKLPQFERATLPEGAIARYGSDRFRTTNKIELLEFTPDGKELHGWDGKTLYRWAFPGGRPLEHLQLPDAVNPNNLPLAHLALSPAHDRVAILRFREAKDELEVWDLNQGKRVFNRNVPLAEKDDFVLLKWSGDGKTLATVSRRGQINTYDGQGTPVASLPPTAQEWSACQLDASFRFALFSGWKSGGGKSAVMLDATNGKQLWTNETFQEQDDIVLSRNGQAFIESRQVGAIKILDSKTGELLKTIKSQGREIKLKPGLFAADGSRAFTFGREFETSKVDNGKPAARLTFIDLKTGKEERVPLDPEIVELGRSALSPDGNYLAVQDAERLRNWDTRSHKELETGAGFPHVGGLVISKGAAHLQLERNRFALRDGGWSSFDVECAQMRTLETPSRTPGMTLGLGARGVCRGDREFVAITDRSINRWDLANGRWLSGNALPVAPMMDGYQIGYDECLILGDGSTNLQFACYVQGNSTPDKREYIPTWRLVRQGQEAEAKQITLPFTWQRGAAALPRQRFLFFAVPPKDPTSKDDMVAPGVTFKQRGESRLYFGRIDKPQFSQAADFSGQWSELRGVNRHGRQLLMSTSESAWADVSRYSSQTWYDPSKFRNSLLEISSGDACVDAVALSKQIADRPAFLSEDGCCILIGGRHELQIYEPYILRKVIKKIPLSASPRLFAYSADGGRMVCQLDDTTMMIWDSAVLSRWVDDAIRSQIPKDLSPLVEDLKAGSITAFRAARLLSAAGDKGVAALRKVEGRKLDPDRLARLIRELDDPKFPVRQQAESDLASWGHLAEKQLTDALAKKPPAETSERLQRLISKLKTKPVGDIELAQLRAVLALEWNVSPEARQLLKEWAEKFPETTLGSEAKESLATQMGK